MARPKADERAAVARLCKSPLSSEEVSPVPEALRSPANDGFSIGDVGTRICRDVFQKRRPAESSSHALFPCKSGRADARTRTGDPFITSEVLYQLSYVGGPGSV
jgi:hypothetical protein